MRGKKTSPETIYQIMASWAVTGSYQQTSRDLGVPLTTVKKIVDNNKDKPEFEELCSEKRIQFSKKAERIINKALDRLEAEIDDSDCSIPVNHLTTVIGTLYDKKALADGSATENVAVEIRLPPGVDEYAE